MKLRKVLVVTNLSHSYPRVPAFIKELSSKYDITVIDYRLVKNGSDVYDLGEVKVINVSGLSDFFDIFKKRNLSKDSGGSLNNLKNKAGIYSFLIEHIFKLIQTLICWPDNNFTVIRKLTSISNKELFDNHYDLIYTSSPYHSVHVVASRLSQKYKITWVAEFRDGWSTNHNYPYFSFRRKLDEYFEKKVIRKAASIVTVNESLADKLSKIHSHKIDVIYNGFEKTNFRPIFKSHEKLKIIYTGKIYFGNQNPNLILEVMNNLIQDKIINVDEIQIEFYGPKYTELVNVVDRLGLKSVVNFKGISDWRTVRKAQSEADILLLFGWENNAESEIFPLKLYEYIASGKQILLTGGGKSNYKILKIFDHINTGILADSKKTLEYELVAIIREFRKKGYIFTESNEENVLKYSLSEQAKNMVHVFEAALDKKK